MINPTIATTTVIQNKPAIPLIPVKWVQGPNGLMYPVFTPAPSQNKL